MKRKERNHDHINNKQNQRKPLGKGEYEVKDEEASEQQCWLPSVKPILEEH